MIGDIFNGLEFPMIRPGGVGATSDLSVHPLLKLLPAVIFWPFADMPWLNPSNGECPFTGNTCGIGSTGATAGTPAIAQGSGVLQGLYVRSSNLGMIEDSNTTVLANNSTIIACAELYDSSSSQMIIGPKAASSAHSLRIDTDKINGTLAGFTDNQTPAGSLFPLKPFVCATSYDGAAVRLNINGKAHTSIARSTTMTNAVGRLGCFNGGASVPLKGWIYDVMVLDYAMSDADMSAISRELMTYRGIHASDT